MKILWFSWKDITHPQAGGAEVVANELAKRLVQDGHQVIFLNPEYYGSHSEQDIDGYHVIRRGGRLSGYWKARQYYKKHLKNWPDLVIEEVNTVPFFTRFYVKQRRVLLFHMLCRKIWFYQLRFPFSLFGWLVEPLYLRLLNKDPVITVSQSTKRDLQRYGFKPQNITIISEGIQLEPVQNLGHVKKYQTPTMLSLGALRAMKRTHQQVKAFEYAKQLIPNLRLVIAGDANDDYGQKVINMIKKHPYRDDIHYLGKVSQAEKVHLLRKSHLIALTSVKEGWGLTVTEAASQGTPAVVYDVDGLRDSVRENETGLIAHENTPLDLANKIADLFRNNTTYKQLQEHARNWSKGINFTTSYQQFKEVLGV